MFFLSQPPQASLPGRLALRMRLRPLPGGFEPEVPILNPPDADPLAPGVKPLVCGVCDGCPKPPPLNAG